jgi:hypothetical protein
MHWLGPYGVKYVTDEESVKPTVLGRKINAGYVEWYPTETI